MEYIFANPDDLSKWLEVAADVGEIMRVPDMYKNAEFIEYAERKLEQNNAIMAYDGYNKKCAGFIGFSRSNNSIGWLGVIKAYRNRGIGSKLLVAAINELNRRKRITVNTYPDNYPPGKPARKLYFSHGFEEATGDIFIHDGLEMVELELLKELEY